MVAATTCSAPYVPDDFPVLADPDRLEHLPVLQRLKHGFIQIHVVGQISPMVSSRRHDDVAATERSREAAPIVP